MATLVAKKSGVKRIQKPAAKGIREQDAYGYRVVMRPAGFKPTDVFDVPKNAEPVKDGIDYSTMATSQEFARRYVAAYNRRSLARGWSTWAVVTFDRELAEVTRRCQLHPMRQGMNSIHLHTRRSHSTAGMPITVWPSIHGVPFVVNDHESLVVQVVRSLRAAIDEIETKHCRASGVRLADVRFTTVEAVAKGGAA